MSGRFRPDDDDPDSATGSARSTIHVGTEPPRPTLRLEVVEYPDRARCTMHPPGLTGVERMSTWISADRSALLDLDAFR